MSRTQADQAPILVDLLRSQPLLAIAPHPDDIALSVGGLLRLLAGGQVTLLTIFTLSRWAPLSAGPATSTDKVSKIRAAEDRRYASAIGAVRREGGLPDTSARGLPESARTLPPNEGDPLHVAIRELVEAALRGRDALNVLCSLALGSHVDHVLVRDATLGLADRIDHLVLYEDLPYAAALDEDEIPHHALAATPQARPVDLNIDAVFAQKLNDVRLYASQIRREELVAVHEHARRTSVTSTGLTERVWVASRGGAQHG